MPASEREDYPRLLREIISNVGVGIHVVQNGRFIYVSPLFQELTGYGETELLGKDPFLFICPEDRDRTRDTAVERLKTRNSEAYEYRFMKHCGDIIWVLEKVSSIQYRGTRAALASFMDITERKRAEVLREEAVEALRHSEERYRSMIEQMEDGYFEIDLSGALMYVNEAMCQQFGYSREDLIGKSYRNHDFVPDRQAAGELVRTFNGVYRTGTPVKACDVYFLSSDGTRICNEISISLIRDRLGVPTGFRGIARDVSERKRQEERIQYLATHDTLTGLPNRVMFSQLLNHAIQSAKRHTRMLALLFIDLDRFKIINDSLGHEAGDQLLCEMAERFTKVLRSMDVVARFGGDEFVAMIEGVEQTTQVEVVAHKLVAAAMEPFSIRGEECRVTASIGISIYPKDGEDEAVLLKKADRAMYGAKEEGKNTFLFYSDDRDSPFIERLSLERNLRFALDRGELFLDYQAKVDFKTGTITGVEALLRWNSPLLGAVTPTRFIPVAEETGMIIPIGRWVLKTACRQNVAWQEQGLPPLCMAVNLSLRQLMDETLTGDIEDALDESGMEPRLLELEITESMVMYHPERMLAVLGRIKGLGVRLAIDDFGTGYSSLAQIRSLPVDTLKVDRSFIRNLPHDEKDMSLTKTIIALARSLNLTVVAEGVETEEQMNYLSGQSCDMMQGFYFSKPVSADAFASLLRKRRLPTRK